MNTASMIFQVVGNNLKDQANKTKTHRDGGTEAVGPEFRPVQGGTPNQTNKNDGPLSRIQKMMGQGQFQFNNQGTQGADAAEAAGAADAAGAAGGISDERIKVPTQERDLLAEVAEMINNYTYHYKPGVGEDPSIEYSGPMAQELLQVDGYRSCVFEDPETGLLQVDTNRLAMVNTGMIADLTKRLLFLEEFIMSVMSSLQQPEVQQIPGQMPGQMPDVE